MKKILFLVIPLFSVMLFFSIHEVKAEEGVSDPQFEATAKFDLESDEIQEQDIFDEMEIMLVHK